MELKQVTGSILEVRKKMRVAYVGLSSPTGYFYGIKDYIEDHAWGWNPILESPQGLSILYDEIWFLHKALCPASMLNLPYIKFLEDERETLIHKILKVVFLNQVDESIKNYVDTNSPADFTHFSSHIYRVFGNEPSLRYPVDNHSHEFHFCNAPIFGDSQRPDLLINDLMILEALEFEYPQIEFELVTNKFTTPRLEFKPIELYENQLAQNFLSMGMNMSIPYIPVIQNEVGPNLNLINIIRDDNNLIDFREKILSEINKEQTNNKYDIEKIAAEMRSNFRNYTKETLNSSKGGLTWSYSNLLRWLTYLVPNGDIIRGGINTVENMKENGKKSDFRWASFVMSLEEEKEKLEMDKLENNKKK
ncbi:hypothetical protein V7152_18945 [Neobacillus drentensis]|uniref:hypothetical protein n=1 Tax=Neobacillus drentensis TaxID=220684 RepID=UPI003000873E